MASNVYTKNEILQNLASRGYFIDAYTLDTFFEKWKVEAIFEGEQGREFYDKNALDLVLSNLFNQEKEDEVQEPQKQDEKEVQKQETFQTTIEQEKSETTPDEEEEKLNIQEDDFKIDDSETNSILKEISLSDGTPLIDKIQEDVPESIFSSAGAKPKAEQPAEVETPKQENKIGILEGALSSNQNFPPEITPITVPEIIPPNEENNDFDDISLLSESLEAQEKFREYVVSELSKKNVDLTPKNNEFKLDISERTLNMIARTMAKKIAKHVSAICSTDAKSAAQLAEIKEQNKRLENRTKDLEEQNKKLRLLLAESNKNLNSYKPSIFGLYKKVNPGK